MVLETKSFYEKLYPAHEVAPVDLSEYFRDTKVTKVTESELSRLEGELTMTEPIQELKGRKMRKVQDCTFLNLV